MLGVVQVADIPDKDSITIYKYGRNIHASLYDVSEKLPSREVGRAGFSYDHASSDIGNMCRVRKRGILAQGEGERCNQRISRACHILNFLHVTFDVRAIFTLAYGNTKCAACENNGCL